MPIYQKILKMCRRDEEQQVEANRGPDATDEQLSDEMKAVKLQHMDW